MRALWRPQIFPLASIDLGKGESRVRHYYGDPNGLLPRPQRSELIPEATHLSIVEARTRRQGIIDNSLGNSGTFELTYGLWNPCNLLRPRRARRPCQGAIVRTSGGPLPTQMASTPCTLGSASRMNAQVDL